eukprot:CAMPEP_0205830682 /NCGR_PEP_ID=MMETSP0206-20130828/41862_1 /ASSEMBLY_ACC=CAM_ASM_000279 /TAXON_ID=36767 /ORGANISM="Euplotes focardii, Strain TN1" /LENGTH=80 /DNA_ID=CAMNT_0053134583 /DNA_START=185 /DNA_END=425 /DNA_ORIENTATION=-
MAWDFGRLVQAVASVEPAEYSQRHTWVARNVWWPSLANSACSSGLEKESKFGAASELACLRKCATPACALHLVVQPAPAR